VIGRNVSALVAAQVVTKAVNLLIAVALVRCANRPGRVESGWKYSRPLTYRVIDPTAVT